MREVINFNTKWAFTKEATEVPKAGVNPIAVAGAGREMNATSLGVMLPVAGIGAIVMPWLIGVIADRVGLVTGMFCNLIPCVGILVFSVLILKYQAKN